MATFTNQATLTYNGQTTTSNVTVGELVETLTAAKTAVRNINVVHTSGIGDRRLRDVIFLTQKFISLIQLPLLRDVGIISSTRSVQRLSC